MHQFFVALTNVCDLSGAFSKRRCCRISVETRWHAPTVSALLHSHASVIFCCFPARRSSRAAPAQSRTTDGAAADLLLIRRFVCQRRETVNAAMLAGAAILSLRLIFLSKRSLSITVVQGSPPAMSVCGFAIADAVNPFLVDCSVDSGGLR